MKKTGAGIPIFTILMLACLPSRLHSKTITVPDDHLTIKSAVAASRAGDTVLVKDGVYFEKNIIVDKDIRIAAETLFGAVIYGSTEAGTSIFLIRAETEIAGFVLTNSYYGLKQRDSPDVTWKGSDLACIENWCGISIDDRQGHIGSAILERIVIDRCTFGIVTNDAGHLYISDSVVANCEAAFFPFDHLTFVVEQSAVVACEKLIRKDEPPVVEPGTHEIVFDRSAVFSCGSEEDPQPRDIPALLSRILRVQNSPYAGQRESGRKWDSLIDAFAGDVAFRDGGTRDAYRHYERAKKTAEETGFRLMVLRAAMGAARAAESFGEEGMAVSHYKTAAAEIVALLPGFPFSNLYEGMFESRARVFGALVEKLYILSRRYADRQYAADALRYSEIAKSAGLLSSLIRHQAESLAATSVPSMKREAKILGRIASLQRRLRILDLLAPERAAMLERLEDQEDEYRAFLYPRPGGASSTERNIDPFIPDAGRLANQVLNQETALIEYFLGPTSAFAFFVTKSRFEMIRLDDAGLRDPLVPHYIDFLSESRGREFGGRKGGRLLHDRLLRPLRLEESPEIKRIIVVPDGVLNYLPFETLVLPDGRFAVEEYEISYAPSASYLVFSNEWPRRNGRLLDLVAISNSGLGRQDGLLSAGGLGASPLRNVDKEIRAVGGFFESRKKIILRGERATESNIKRLDLSGARIIHLAAHGIFDDRHWWRSALLLDPANGPAEDGLLQSFEIVGLDLNADLVVLSMCESGNAPLQRGKDIVGLQLSFFIAGAKAVLSNLWKVDDASAAFFMKKMYASLVGGESPAASVRSAKLAMIRSRFSHPRYWAPSVVQGDSSTPIFRFPLD